MNDRSPLASNPIDTAQILYGADPLERIVAVEPAGPDRMRLFLREPGAPTTTIDERFEPWLLAERGEPWAGLWSNPSVEPLAGDHAYRFLVTFRDWSSLLDAARAAQDAGERFFRLRSPVEQHLVRIGHTLFKGMTFDDLRRLQIDIETTGFDASDPASEVIVVALRGPDGVVETLWAEQGEADLIERTTERICAIDPDTIEGHNLFNFDLPFLATRAARHGLGLHWGRDGSTLRLGNGSARFKAGPLTMPYTPAYVHGRHVIDTYQQIQRYDIGGKLTSYGLKQAVDELGLTRSGREFVPGERISEVWRTDRDRLLRYAGDDVLDVDTLSRLATPTEFYQAQLLPRSYQSVATGGPGEKLNDLMLRAYLMQGHSVPAAERARDYPGGHAELLETGVFRPVVKCDVESLYPSIMLSEGITSSRDSLGAYLPMLAELTRRRLQAESAEPRQRGRDDRCRTGDVGGHAGVVQGLDQFVLRLSRLQRRSVQRLRCGGTGDAGGAADRQRCRLLPAGTWRDANRSRHRRRLLRAASRRRDRGRRRTIHRIDFRTIAARHPAGARRPICGDALAEVENVRAAVGARRDWPQGKRAAQPSR